MLTNGPVSYDESMEEREGMGEYTEQSMGFAGLGNKRQNPSGLRSREKERRT